MGYGIGDELVVMEPSCVFPVCRHEVLKEIPLADGSRAVEFPHPIKATRRWVVCGLYQKPVSVKIYDPAKSRNQYYPGKRTVDVEYGRAAIGVATSLEMS